MSEKIRNPKPEKELKSFLDKLEFVHEVESGALRERTQKDAEVYKSEIKEYLKTSVEMIYPEFLDQYEQRVNFVRDNDLEAIALKTFDQNRDKYRKLVGLDFFLNPNVDQNTFLDAARLSSIHQTIKGNNVGFFSLLDENIYIREDLYDRIEKINDDESMDLNVDIKAVGLQNTLIHEIGHAKEKDVEQIPEWMSDPNSEFGKFLHINKIRGLGVVGYDKNSTNGKIDFSKYRDLDGLNEAANTIISKWKVEKSGMIYLDDFYTVGADFLDLVLKKTGLSVPELEDIKNNHGLPTLLQKWSEFFGGDISKARELFFLTNNVTQFYIPQDQAIVRFEEMLKERKDAKPNNIFEIVDRVQN